MHVQALAAGNVAEFKLAIRLYITFPFLVIMTGTIDNLYGASLAVINGRFQVQAVTALRATNEICAWRRSDDLPFLPVGRTSRICKMTSVHLCRNGRARHAASGQRQTPAAGHVFQKHESLAARRRWGWCNWPRCTGDTYFRP